MFVTWKTVPLLDCDRLSKEHARALITLAARGRVQSATRGFLLTREHFTGDTVEVHHFDLAAIDFLFEQMQMLRIGFIEVRVRVVIDALL